MAKPRCGLPDVDVDEKPLKRRRRFAVFGIVNIHFTTVTDKFNNRINYIALRALRIECETISFHN